MDKQTRSGAFFLRLAWQNIMRNKRIFVPYYIACSMIATVFLLIIGMIFSDTLKNLPTGATAVGVFSLGISVFAVFSFCFMAYINNFLISQRKREFGLYGILGLERRHVFRVLIWENAIILLAGLLTSCICALVFGQLIFWALLKVIRAVPGSSFSLAPMAFAFTFALFLLIFAYNAFRSYHTIRLLSPMELMQHTQKGEKESRLVWPLAILGLIALSIAYYFSWTIKEPSMALFLFFLLALLVIFATFVLCDAGSVVLLKLLKKNRSFYYTPAHFVTVSGLCQRMKQNARSLAVICILSTMLVVTVSGTLSLYLGQEEMLSGMYPYNISVSVAGEVSDDDIRDFEQSILSLAEKRNVSISADPSKLTRTPPEDDRFLRNNYMPESARCVELEKLIYFDGVYRFDAEGDIEECIAFSNDIRNAYRERFTQIPKLIVSEVFTTRQEGYGLYGGLLFLGAFFALLFLSITVLLIYFKQITEGYDDRSRYVLLQQVGMDDDMVRHTIDRQVLWIFFIPLGLTALHMAFASQIIARMLQCFMLYDWLLVLGCISGVLLLFALTYLFVYRATAKVYYRIVKW